MWSVTNEPMILSADCCFAVCCLYDCHRNQFILYFVLMEFIKMWLFQFYEITLNITYLFKNGFKIWVMENNILEQIF
jgi:hypothetical protein